MTVGDNLIVMWRGLYPYSRVLLKRRGALGEAGCPAARARPRASGAAGRGPSAQPLGKARCGRTDRLHASGSSYKVTLCGASFPEQMEKTVQGFSPRY